MRIQPTISNLSVERVQINRLSGFAFMLNTIAAIPGFMGSAFLLVIAARELFPKTRTFTASDWLEFLPLFGAAIIGWWLYATYGLELEGSNRYGKVTWFVSTLANAGGVIFAASSIIASTSVGPSLVVLLWCLIMTIISARVWVLRTKEPKGEPL